MSRADELLESITSETNMAGGIVVMDDRFMIVPEHLKRIAVQYDHNVRTVTFNCPRYLNGHDASKMQIYVNYVRADEHRGSHLCDNVSVDESDPNLIHFDWTISGHVTYVDGHIAFMLCLKMVDDDGNESIHWNSEINTDMYVSPGIKHTDAILAKYPDIIAQLISRIETLESAIASLTEEE